jgi:hypothetical protein
MGYTLGVADDMFIEGLYADIGIFIKWLTDTQEMLPNGCVPSGHRYWDYGMCKICGEYE